MTALSFATAQIGLLYEDDLDDVVGIERRCNSHPWTREHFEDALRSGYLCLVAREQQRIIGFAIARVLVDDAELLLIAVEPNHRRGGCASLLLQTLIERLQANEKSPLHLEVRASNEGAIAFYEARQFVRSGLRKNYYPNGVLGNQREDAVLMQRAV
jgi:ribosomal-protein-alanine acetyltransferase